MTARPSSRSVTEDAAAGYVIVVTPSTATESAVQTALSTIDVRPPPPWPSFIPHSTTDGHIVCSLLSLGRAFGQCESSIIRIEGTDSAWD
jgi:hypothetical protein